MDPVWSFEDIFFTSELLPVREEYIANSVKVENDGRRNDKADGSKGIDILKVA